MDKEDHKMNSITVLIKLIGMDRVLSGIVNELDKQLASKEEDYIKTLRGDIQAALDNYRKRYGDDT
jgi:hypothetical protein